jgi:tetratricopeptide (TPR) repeat protein
VSHEPNTAESWLNLAIAEYETKQYELALTHFKKVMSLRNDCVLVQDYINKLTERIANKAMPSSQLVASIH